MPAQEYALPRTRALRVSRIGRPKRPFLATISRKLGETLELLESNRGKSLTNAQFEEISRYVYFATSSLFKENLHEARNYLTVAADILAKIQRKKLPLKRPTGVKLRKLKSFRYYDKLKHTDLWDTIKIPTENPREKYFKQDPMFSRILAYKMMKPKNRLTLKRSKIMCKLADAALELSPKIFLERELEDQTARFDILVENDATLPMDWKTKKIPIELLNKLEAGGEFTTDSTFQQVLFYSAWNLFFSLPASRQSIDSGDYTKAREILDLNEKLLVDWQTIIQYIVDAENEQASNVHQAVRDNDIWDLILKCTAGQFKDKFEASLDDWYGTKKYIVAGLCAGPAYTLIMVSAGGALFLALESFVACFVCHMLYGIMIEPADCILGIAWDITTCIFESAF